MANPNDIANLTARLSAAYPNWNVSALTNEMYYEDLKDIPADELMIAAQFCRTDTNRDQRFAPSAGEIRKAVSELRRKSQNIPSVIQAWNEVCSAPKPYPADYVIYRGGERVEPPVYKWSHPLVEKIARQFGWPDFPNYENEGTDRAHFFKQYEASLQSDISEMMELPQVTKFIETGDAMKRLADGMRK